MTNDLGPVAAIVNPKSAGGKTGRNWGRIHAGLEKACGSVSIFKTQSSGHAIDLATQAIRAGHKTIIAVGGDGTLNEVVNGLFADGRPISRGITIGLIPQGTGSDFRRTMQIPLDEPGAIRTIRDGNTIKLDVMKVIYRRPDGSDGTRYAANLTSFGMGGAVATRVNRSTKPLGGTIAFLVATALTTVGFRGNTVALKTDDVELSDVLITNVAIGNGRYHGSGMLVCPKATVDDGLLDITIVEKMSLWELTLNIPMLYNGNIYDHPKVHYHRTRKLSAMSKEPSRIEIDGEPLGTLPLEATIIPGGLRLLVP
jgi:YegS/Rv2252/BmrU family lipid kinase